MSILSDLARRSVGGMGGGSYNPLLEDEEAQRIRQQTQDMSGFANDLDAGRYAEQGIPGNPLHGTGYSFQSGLKAAGGYYSPGDPKTLLPAVDPASGKVYMKGPDGGVDLIPKKKAGKAGAAGWVPVSEVRIAKLKKDANLESRGLEASARSFAEPLTLGASEGAIKIAQGAEFSPSTQSIQDILDGNYGSDELSLHLPKPKLSEEQRLDLVRRKFTPEQLQTYAKETGKEQAFLQDRQDLYAKHPGKTAVANIAGNVLSASSLHPLGALGAGAGVAAEESFMGSRAAQYLANGGKAAFATRGVLGGISDGLAQGGVQVAGDLAQAKLADREFGWEAIALDLGAGFGFGVAAGAAGGMKAAKTAKLAAREANTAGVMKVLDKYGDQISKDPAVVAANSEIRRAQSVEKASAAMTPDEIAIKTKLDEDIDVAADALLPSHMQRSVRETPGTGAPGEPLSSRESILRDDPVMAGLNQETVGGSRNLLLQNNYNSPEAAAARRVGRAERARDTDPQVRARALLDDMNSRFRARQRPPEGPVVNVDDIHLSGIDAPASGKTGAMPLSRKDRAAQDALRSDPELIRDNALVEAGVSKVKSYDELADVADKAAANVANPAVAAELRQQAQALRDVRQRALEFTGSRVQQPDVDEVTGIRPPGPRAKTEAAQAKLGPAEYQSAKKLAGYESPYAPAGSGQLNLQGMAPPSPGFIQKALQFAGGGSTVTQGIAGAAGRAVGGGLGYAAASAITPESGFASHALRSFGAIMGGMIGGRSARKFTKPGSMPERLIGKLQSGVNRLGSAAWEAGKASAETVLSPKPRGPLVSYLKAYDSAENGDTEESAATLGQQAKKVGDMFRAATANPEATQRKVYNELGEIRMEDPRLAQQLEDFYMAKVQFLAEKAPPVNISASPFLRRKEMANDADSSAFARYVRAASDPLVLLDELADGAVNAETVQTVKKLYPRVFKQMQQLTTERLMGLENMNYAQRFALSQVFDISLEPTLEPKFAASINAFFGEQQPKDEDKGPGSNGGYQVPTSGRNKKVSPKSFGTSTAAQRQGG